ncbi:hypothetical protein D920_01934 [Enterococcus faecalis 13-SD-W-01]|nr:hypothetical protein D920_01934 [Enterococcus faecalis 13-SD-W-01]
MYSFDQVIIELNQEIALKTLKNWANKIEKVTDKRFERRYAKNVTGNTYSYKVFSLKDIEGFQKLVCLRKNNIPLNEAMIEVFLSEESKESFLNEQEFLTMKNDVKSLLELSKEISAENAELRKRVMLLEEKVSM